MARLLRERVHKLLDATDRTHPRLRDATHCATITQMLKREYDQVCSIARTLEVLGERWTLLVIRDVFNGQRRFEQIQENLGVARNVLSGPARRGWSTRGSSRSAATRSARRGTSTSSPRRGSTCGR